MVEGSDLPKLLQHTIRIEAYKVTVSAYSNGQLTPYWEREYMLLMTPEEAASIDKKRFGAATAKNVLYDMLQTSARNYGAIDVLFDLDIGRIKPDAINDSVLLISSLKNSKMSSYTLPRDVKKTDSLEIQVQQLSNVTERNF